MTLSGAMTRVVIRYRKKCARWWERGRSEQRKCDSRRLGRGKREHVYVCAPNSQNLVEWNRSEQIGDFDRMLSGAQTALRSIASRLSLVIHLCQGLAVHAIHSYRLTKPWYTVSYICSM